MLKKALVTDSTPVNPESIIAALKATSDNVLRGDILKEEVTFNIEVTMNSRWVNDFCSMLKYMEYCGNIGHSSVVGFYSDGDGDFRPKFNINKEFGKTNGYWQKDGKELPNLEVIFDAG